MAILFVKEMTCLKKVYICLYFIVCFCWGDISIYDIRKFYGRDIPRTQGGGGFQGFWWYGVLLEKSKEEVNQDREKVHYLRWEVYMKEKEDSIKMDFYVAVTCMKGEGRVLGVLWKIILLERRRSTNKLDYMDLIINYLKEIRVGGFERAYMDIHIWSI